MKPLLFKNAAYVKSAVQPKDYPVLRDPQGNPLPEIAVAGRSNVGKSTLLNNLFQAKGLVKTSATPGKTQTINFFTLDEKLVFVDLPGYGYATVPLQVKKRWGPMIQNYLTKRESLQLILFLFDIRRMPNDEDRQMLFWAAEAEKAVILVLTKVDKVGTNEKRTNTKKILEAFDCENLHYVHYSSPKDMGRRELTALIKEALDE